MRIGTYRHRITIQTQTTARDAAGALVPGTWATHATRWANVHAIAGGEAPQAAQLKNTRSYSIAMRYLSTVTEQMRISWDSKVLQIISIVPDETKTEMVITATEVR
ncbi:phage head closure protein [Anatilimnocola floriformis]|uniref:phage head closure protein n=1 Tax=Anatilimnocola floriformis TaxID=2948575 RepID=UPI0036F1CCD2